MSFLLLMATCKYPLNKCKFRITPRLLTVVAHAMLASCTGFSAVSPSACSARMNVVDRTPAWENTFLTLQPTFVVEDWAKARPLMAEFLDKTRTQRGAMYSGWTVCGDKLFCREAFAESAFLLEHLSSVRPSLEALMEPGIARLLEMQLHGPADELSKCEAAMEGLDTQTFEVFSGFTTLVRPYGGMSRGQGFSSLQPSFTVADWDAATPLLERCVALMRAEKGCIFHGWTRSGDRLVCRQAHASTDGLLAHLGNSEVQQTLAELCDGPAILDGVQLHGPMSALEACALAEYLGVGVEGFAIDSGFQKYELTGYNMGLLDLSKGQGGW